MTPTEKRVAEIQARHARMKQQNRACGFDDTSEDEHIAFLLAHIAALEEKVRRLGCEVFSARCAVVDELLASVRPGTLEISVRFLHAFREHAHRAALKRETEGGE